MMKAPRSHAVFFTIIASVYYAVFLQIADLKDTAIFGGDTWEYQSMAVNFAKGPRCPKVWSPGILQYIQV